jgi:hypothetical protein
VIAHDRRRILQSSTGAGTTEGRFPLPCDPSGLRRSNPIDSVKLKPMVEAVLPLSEARKVHELNERGHARGK